MLWPICIVLLLFWTLGMLTSISVDGLIHLLPAAALALAAIGLFQGRRRPDRRPWSLRPEFSTDGLSAGRGADSPREPARRR